MIPVDSRAAYARQLRTRDLPKSPGQLEWEAQVRPQAEAIVLSQGRSLLTPPSSCGDHRRKLGEDLARVERLAELPYWDRIFSVDQWRIKPGSSAAGIRRQIETLDEVAAVYPELPFRRVALPYQDGEISIMADSSGLRGQVAAALQQKAFHPRGDVPAVKIDHLDLMFHRSTWGNEWIKSGDGHLTHTPVFRTISVGLELPKFMRDQIETVIGDMS